LKTRTVKWYLLTLFEIMINTAISKLMYALSKSRLNILKTRTVNGAC